MDRQYRPVRFLINAHLLRQMDEVLSSGLGGFASRDELVEEALNSYLVELQDMRSEGPGPAVQLRPHDRTGPLDTVSAAAREHTGTGLSFIRASVPGFGDLGEAVHINQEPMLGLHNRDWPSIWALSRLGLKALREPVGFRAFLEEVTEEAWALAEELGLRLGGKAKAATQMLPTNRLKKQSADAGFQNFAVASISNKPGSGGLHRAAGPLPVWGAVAFWNVGADTRISVSPHGWELLGIVDGLSPEPPHPQKVAEKFFGYLRHRSPSDWWGFETVLREVAHAPSRDALLARMEGARDWSPSIAASALQGYIARCREWGLVEPKLISGCYRLTDFGKETLKHV